MIAQGAPLITFDSSTRRESVIGLVLFIPLFLLHLWSLLRLPPPFLDEVWYLARVWGYLQTGRVFGDLDRGIFDYFDGYWTVLPWLPIFLKSIFLRFSPVPDLFSIRLATLLFGFLLLLCIYLIGARLGGSRLGLIAASLTAISTPFLLSAHIARTDIEAAFFGYLALTLYFLQGPSRVWVAFLSGFTLMLAYQCHPHGLILALPIAALYFLHQRWAMFRTRLFWAFIGGGVVGVLMFVVVQILPHPDAYFKTMGLNFAQTHIPPILTLDPAILLQSFLEVGEALAVAYPTVTLLILAGLGMGLSLARRSETDKTLLVLALSLLLSYALLVRNKISYYTIFISPVVDLMAAYFLIELFSHAWQGRRAALLTRASVGGLVAIHVAGMLSAFTFNFYPDYQAAQQGVNRMISQGDRIMGPQPYWLELYDHPYYPWEALVYYRRYDSGSTLEEAMARFQPDIFIIDSFMRNFIVDNPTGSIYLEHIHLPKSELETLLARRGQLLVEFENEIYGPIQIYRITWPEETGE